MVNMRSISFKDAEQDIYFDDIKIVATSDSSSYTSKIILGYLFAVLISLPAINYYWGVTLFSIIILSITLMKYLTLNKFQKIINYNIYLYMILQTGVIFFLTVFLYIKKDTNHLVPISYIIISYIFVMFILYLRITSLLRSKYNLVRNNWTRKGEFLANKMTRAVQLLLILIVIGMISYRLNKWWLLNIDVTFQETSVLEYLTWGIGLLLLLLGVTLLPTLLIKPEKLIKYKLIEVYSEEFRERYDYSKKEWYGDS